MTEIEKKFIIKTENFEVAKESIKSCFPVLWKTIEQNDIYFDTDDLTFYNNKCSLRKRQTNFEEKYTLKQNAKTQFGTLIRDEVDICQTVFDALKVKKVIEIQSIKEKGIVNFENAEFEISIDETKFISKDIIKNEYILEIEMLGEQLEKLNLFCENFTNFAQRSNCFELIESDQSKYERGFIKLKDKF